MERQIGGKKCSKMTHKIPTTMRHNGNNDLYKLCKR